MRTPKRESFDRARWARLGAFLVATATGMSAGGCKGDESKAPQAQHGCQTDRDCKGERICVDHACMEPPIPMAEEPEKKVRSQVKEGMLTRNKISWYTVLATKWLEENPGKCPSGVGELVQNPRVPDPLDDAWGQPLLFLCGDTAPEGQKFGIVSVGPDGQEGTSDDLRSW